MGTAATSADLRELNRARALTVIHESAADGLTRVELADRLDVTRTTAAALVSDLSALGLISETVADPTGRRGRPTTKIAPDPDGPCVLCIEIGRGLITVGEMGIGGELTNVEDLPIDDTEPTSVIRRVNEAITERRKGLAGQCAGIGVAMHGLVDDHSGLVIQAPHLQWESVDLGDQLRNVHGLPVIVENDATLGAIVESKLGAGRVHPTMLYVRSTIGVGGGFIFDGKPAPSRRGWHGEVGHLPFGDPNERCSCGAWGCWENAINQRALVQAAGFEDRPGSVNDVALTVLEAARTGDDLGSKAVEMVCSALGRGLGSLINALDPDVIVLSGHVQSLFESDPDTVMASLKDATMSAHRDSLPPVLSGSFDDASVRGAGEVILSELMASPSLLLSTDSGNK